MLRPRTISLAIAILLVTLATSLTAKDVRPNLLFIMSDDHASAAVSAYGSHLAKIAPTRNIDRLAREGMLFRNAFVTNSICTPSRATIFTGKYSHRNGVYKFTALDQSQETLPKLLREAGYHTAFVGKWHLHSNPVGFDSWSILPGQGRYHDPEFIEIGNEHHSGRVRSGKRTRHEGHSSDVIGRKALEYLRSKRPANRPFALFCHFKAPHDTWEFAKRYAGLFANEPIPEPPTLLDDHRGRKALQSTLQYIGSPWGHHTDFARQTRNLQGVARRKLQYQLYMRKYLRCVRGVDDNVGRVLDELDAKDLAKSTTVVYTSDQGFFLGEHGLYDKRLMYEDSLRVPLLVRWPGQVRAGSTSDAIVLNLDFAQTLLEIAGGRAPGGAQGRSFVSILRGDTPDDWRESMYYRYYFSHFKTEPHHGVRTRRYKLIRFHRIDHSELYDLENDPLELENIHDRPESLALQRELEAELNRLREKFGDRLSDHGEKPRTGFEK